jgi:hypothetical protein
MTLIYASLAEIVSASIAIGAADFNGEGFLPDGLAHRRRCRRHKGFNHG